MAGIGGYPQVINLPRDTRWEALGEGLGQIAGGIFDAWNEADATKKAAQIPDIDHRMTYLRSRLGQKGDKYIDDQIRLMQSRENIAKSQAEIEHWKQQDAYRETQDQINKIILQNEQRRLDAEIAAKEHRANATRSRAVGSSAKADQQEASADKARAEADAIREKTERQKQGQQRLEQYFKSQTGGPQTPIPPTLQRYDIPGDGTNGDATNGVTGAKIRPITTSDVVVPAAPQGPGTVDTTRPVGTVSDLPGTAKPGEIPKDLTLEQMEALRKYATSGTQLLTPVPGISQETINEAIAAVGSDKEGEAWKAIKAAKQPKEVRMENIGGGFQALTGLYEDGQRHIVPGSRVEDKRKPMDVQEQRAEQNVVLWQSSNSILRQLSEQPNTPMGKGFFDQLMGSAVGRGVSAWMYRNFGQALTPETPRYLAQYALARTSLDSMMAGLRETDRYRQLLDTTQPGYADSPSVKRAKFDTMQMTADLMIKERIEDALRNGKQYGSGMAELYRTRGLDKMSVQDITDRYMNAKPDQPATRKEQPPTGRDSGSTVIKTPSGDVRIEPD